MVPVPICPFNDPDGFGDARRAHRAQGEGKKFGEGLLSVFIYRKPLKSHKTAKGIFGNPWRKQPEIWKCLEKKLGGWRWRAETNYPVQNGLTPTAGGSSSSAA
jgi:hypothetical protein